MTISSWPFCQINKACLGTRRLHISIRFTQPINNITGEPGCGRTWQGIYTFPIVSHTLRQLLYAIIIANIGLRDYLSTYKFKRAFFRHDRRTAPKFGTHVWIETRLALTKTNWPTPPQRGLGVIYWCLWHVACGMWHAACGMFVGGWFVAWFKPVVDRKLLERLMSPSPKSQVMFASAFSWIGYFFECLGLTFFKLWRVWWI